MLKKKLELILGPISDELFKEAAEEADRDIKINRIAFMQMTSYQDLINIMVYYIKMIRRTFENKKSQQSQLCA